MSIIHDIESLTKPDPLVDRQVAHIFGRPVPLLALGNLHGGERRIVQDARKAGSRYTASFDDVSELIVGGTIRGNATWSEGHVVANFRGKTGKGHNLACAMLAAIMRFYMPELDDTKVS